uniref:uncharacterized protein n=1 Tax=Pristiophorus japonicus TaxID=55135 RepID=UPI00398E4F3F
MELCKQLLDLKAQGRDQQVIKCFENVTKEQKIQIPQRDQSGDGEDDLTIPKFGGLKTIRLYRNLTLRALKGSESKTMTFNMERGSGKKRDWGKRGILEMGRIQSKLHSIVFIIFWVSLIFCVSVLMCLLIYKSRTMTMWILSIWVVWGTFLTALSQGDSLTQPLPSEVETEGEPVTLNCTYDTAMNNYYLYWYRQHPGAQPEFILYKYAHGGEDKAEFAAARFSVILQTANKFTSLTIAGLQLTDAAVYYCALTQVMKMG